jgi:hypothetical protein
MSDPERDHQLGAYQLSGSRAFGRLLELQYDQRFSRVLCAIYFAATWTVPALFIGTSLMALVGPAALGARVLFENDEAIEHEEQQRSRASSQQQLAQ